MAGLATLHLPLLGHVGPAAAIGFLGGSCRRHFVGIMTFISRAPTLALKGMKINSLAGPGRYGKCISFSLPQSLKVGDTHNVTATGLCINLNQLGKGGAARRCGPCQGRPCGRWSLGWQRERSQMRNPFTSIIHMKMTLGPCG